MSRLLFFVFVFCGTSLFGEDAMSPEVQTYNYGSQFVNMLFTLGFVLVLIFASVWILKKLMRSRLQTLNKANGIKILERRPLNPKSSLYLVDILGKGVVISESPAGINIITEFPEGVNVESLLDEHLLEKTSGPSFSEVLSGKIKTMILRKNA